MYIWINENYRVEKQCYYPKFFIECLRKIEIKGLCHLLILEEPDEHWTLCTILCKKEHGARKRAQVLDGWVF
jgi:hypothetical protein